LSVFGVGRGSSSNEKKLDRQAWRRSLAARPRSVFDRAAAAWPRPCAKQTHATKPTPARFLHHLNTMLRGAGRPLLERLAGL
jgi:hypothetical protein